MGKHVKLKSEKDKGKKPSPNGVERWIAIDFPSQKLMKAGPEALDRYLVEVRADVQHLLDNKFPGTSTVRYDLMKGTLHIRGGHFASPGVALQELLHEVAAAARPASAARTNREREAASMNRGLR